MADDENPSAGSGQALSRGFQPGEIVAVTCAFCRGRGIYPFGHPPSRANCGVCNGRGRVLIRFPYAACPACGGTGRDPKMIITCRRCAGKGVVAVRDG